MEEQFDYREESEFTLTTLPSRNSKSLKYDNKYQTSI